MKRTFLLAALLLAACAKPQRDPGKPDIQVAQVWARETVAGQTGTAAYMKIANFGSGEDRLISVSASPPAVATLHQSSNENGVARMRPLDGGLAIPARQVVTLEPGAVHVMIMGLPAPLKPGDALRLALKFERSGERTVAARITGAEQR